MKNRSITITMLSNFIIYHHRSRFFAVHILILLCLLVATHDAHSSEPEHEPEPIPIGVVLDTNSPMGSMVDLCMKMAISDFYTYHPHYATRLHLHTRNAQTLLQANFAAVELLKHEAVQGIIGPHGSAEETFFAELGQHVRVPIVSFASGGSAMSYRDNRYFVRTAPDDAVQARALAAVCKGFQWSEFALLYEDTDSGSQFASLLNKVFREVDIALAYMVGIPNSANDAHILNELNKLAAKRTRVLLVHVSPSLGSRLFPLAKTAGVMGGGYAWIITNSLSLFMNSMSSATHDSMEGVVGIRPYLSRSKKLESFRERWKRYVPMESFAGSIMELNAYGLWAYDAVTALAIAVENINSSILNVSTAINRTEKSNLSISSSGPELVSKLSSTRYRGLSGNFELANGKLKTSSTYEIFNVIGSGERSVGFWTPDRGIVRDLSTSGSANEHELKSIVWPGDSLTRPKGWDINPTNGRLRVGIPWKKGFKEFVNATNDPTTSHVNASGFCIEIFLATLKALPFHINYDFYIYNETQDPKGTYDNMLHKIPKDFDMVVGDTTSWAPRAEYVDFSLPYSESGIILVVKNKKPLDMWIFVKPLSWDLWLAIIVAFILLGVVLLILERRVAISGTDSMRASRTAILSPVVVLAFPERNMVANSWSFLVLVFWIFMAYILMQSYSANLTAILTVDQIKFAFSDNHNVGYQNGSFMKKFLTAQLHINESRLISCASAEDYHKAMTLGSEKGGIDVIFDEIPYMKFFLSKYDSQYKNVGPTYRSGGFGFAFPKGSPLAAHFSKAILDVTQGPNMTVMEQANLGPGYSSQDPRSSTISQGTSSLGFHEFRGLFLIIGSVTLLALFCSETPIGRKLTVKITQCLHSYFHFMTSRDATAAGELSGDHDIHESLENNVIITSPSPQHLHHGEVEMHDMSLSDETSAAQNPTPRIDSDGEST